MTDQPALIRAAFRRRLLPLFSGVAALAATLVITQSASAQRLGLPGQKEAETGSWTKLTNQPPFQTDTGLLLTDGTVMMHQYSSANWWRLTPDSSGSYLNGTWSQLASMVSTYGPLYFASAVLPDGRVLVEGGEYNKGAQTETNMGAIYDPVVNTWTTVNPPAGWSTIGDSPCVVLKDGTFMMGQGGFPSTKQALFNAATLTWTPVGTGKADAFSEEGLTILPDGTVLLIDTTNGTNSERYNPTTQLWSTAGSTIVKLTDASSEEIGPKIQRPDGTVVAFGGTVHNSIYNTTTSTWTVGPDFPGGNDMADAPAAILPDGNILVFTSPGVFNPPGTFYFFDGITFTPAPPTQSSGNLTSYQGRQLVLPTGQVLWVAAEGRTIDAELFTSTGTANPAWAPTIRRVPRTITRGTTFQISGTQFNGLSDGSDYGDDATNATNYPIVRLTNQASGHVFYARTHDHSSMGIATGSTIVSTMVDLPANVETGRSTIEVVANGIASGARRITVQ
ncbi:MAG: hypothetical protein H0X40_15210 [Chthoniobacterales bacterium]|nr:hypothetical protein [Chthoniobacterales bacterium]